MFKKKYLYISIFIAIILLVLGYNVSSNLYSYQNRFIPQRINLSFFQIFIKNFSSCILILILSILGPISSFIIMNLFFSLGAGIHMTKISYSTSIFKTLIGFLPHSLGEMLILTILLTISIHITLVWIKYLFGKNFTTIKKIYTYYFREKIIYIIIFIAIVLLISSIIEVYWSAPYFDKLYTN